MIASVPQIAVRLNAPVKSVSVRQTPVPSNAAEGDFCNSTGTPASTPQKSPQLPTRTAAGSLQSKLTTTTETATPAPPSAFSHAWASALEQGESTIALRLRNTKGLAMPLPDPKSEPQSRTNDNVLSGIFSNVKTSEKTDPLPLVLSFNAPQPASPEQNNAGSSKTAEMKTGAASQSLSETGNEDQEESLQIAQGDLAFTAKFKSPAIEATDEPAPVVGGSTALATKLVSAPQAIDVVPVSKIAVDAPATPTMAGDAPETSGETADSSIKISSALRSEPVGPSTAAPASAPQPMKEIAFQLPGARGVEVRLTERAGEVHIDVRTGDAALTQDLRGNLHELVSGLERKGISAEVTHLPEHSTAPAARSADTGASKDQTPGGQGGAFDRQPQQRNRQPGQAPEPTTSKARATAWNEQATTSFAKENQ